MSTLPDQLGLRGGSMEKKEGLRDGGPLRSPLGFYVEIGHSFSDLMEIS